MSQSLNFPTKYVIITSASLSALASLFIIISYFLFPHMRSLVRRLVFLLSICDYCQSIFWIFLALTPNDENKMHLKCMTQVMVIEYFNITAGLWTLSIALNSYFVVCKLQKFPRKFISTIGPFIWLIPFLIIMAAFIYEMTDKYHTQTEWCFLSTNKNYIFYIIDLPMYIFWIIDLFLYFLVWKELKRWVNVSNSSQHISYYLTVFLICKGFSLVNRISGLFLLHPLPILSLLHATFSPLIGFFNMLAYGFNKKLQWNYSIFFHNIMNGLRLQTRLDDVEFETMDSVWIAKYPPPKRKAYIYSSSLVIHRR